MVDLLEKREEDGGMSRLGFRSKHNFILFLLSGDVNAPVRADEPNFAFPSNPSPGGKVSTGACSASPAFWAGSFTKMAVGVILYEDLRDRQEWHP
ncbi:MAG: hypothetical protein QHH30_10450 [candidate division NC10 bacterium]|nr:hypothetical protein [candidate division NC10 bacterium]